MTKERCCRLMRNVSKYRCVHTQGAKQGCHWLMFSPSEESYYHYYLGKIIIRYETEKFVIIQHYMRKKTHEIKLPIRNQYVNHKAYCWQEPREMICKKYHYSLASYIFHHLVSSLSNEIVHLYFSRICLKVSKIWPDKAGSVNWGGYDISNAWKILKSILVFFKGGALIKGTL